MLDDHRTGTLFSDHVRPIDPRVKAAARAIIGWLVAGFFGLMAFALVAGFVEDYFFAREAAPELGISILLFLLAIFIIAVIGALGVLLNRTKDIDRIVKHFERLTDHDRH